VELRGNRKLDGMVVDGGFACSVCECWREMSSVRKCWNKYKVSGGYFGKVLESIKCLSAEKCSEK